MAVEHHRLTDDVLGAVKLLLPHPVTDNGDESGGVQPVLLVREGPTPKQWHAERLEVVARDQPAAQGEAPGRQGQREPLELMPQQRPNRRATRHVLEILRVAVGRLRSTVDAGSERDQSARLNTPRRLRQDAVHHGEDGGISADHQGDQQDGGACDTGRALQTPQRIPSVAAETVEPGTRPGLADPFFHLIDTTELDARLAPCVIRRHAARHQIADVLVEMEPQLLLKVAIEALTAEPRHDAGHVLLRGFEHERDGFRQPLPV